MVRKCLLVSLALAVMLGVSACGAAPETGQTVEEGLSFAGPNLEAAIREAVHKSEGPIYASDLEELTSLDASDSGISGLDELSSGKNPISDISPLVSVASLTRLDIRENPLSTSSLEVTVPELEAKGVTVFQ